MAKRKRATAIVVNGSGEVLLVRDKGKHRYSFPGGGVNRNEPSIAAAAREVFEETGLVPHKAEWVCDYEGGTQQHTVFRIEAHGKPRLKSELDGIKWWNRNDDIARFDHVDQILRKARQI